MTCKIKMDWKLLWDKKSFAYALRCLFSYYQKLNNPDNMIYSNYYKSLSSFKVFFNLFS